MLVPLSNDEIAWSEEEEEEKEGGTASDESFSRDMVACSTPKQTTPPKVPRKPQL